MDVSGQPMKRRIAPTAAIAPTRRQVSRVSIAVISVRSSAVTAIRSALVASLSRSTPTASCSAAAAIPALMASTYSGVRAPALSVRAMACVSSIREALPAARRKAGDLNHYER